MPRYQVVRWRHDHLDEPVTIYSEVDDEGWELRKVEEYADGRLDLADHCIESGSTQLSERVIPSIEEITTQPAFTPGTIPKEEFERVWRTAWSWFDRS